jgi:hypothetical protein
MKKLLGFVLVGGIALFMLTACSWPWGNAPKIESMKISVNSGALPPEYYTEGTMNIKPDYTLRTVAVDYSSSFPYKKVPADGDNFKGNAIIGGEFFDRFEEIVKILNKDLVFDSGKEACVGASVVKVTVKGLDLKENIFDIPGCLDNSNKATIIKPYYDDVVGLLSKNVY